MTQIVEGVHRLGTALVNFYLVEDGGRYTLVDAGLPGYFDGLQEALEARGKGLDALDAPGRPRIVATPGHTDGHCSVHFEQHGVLFTGDALCSRNPLTGRVGPQVMPPAFNTSTQRALASLDRIAGLAVSHLLFGHGEPWTDGARSAVERARELGPS